MTIEEAKAILAAEERRKAKRTAASKKLRCECCGKHVHPDNINYRLTYETRFGVKVCDECNNYYSDEQLRRYTYEITSYPASWTTGSHNLVANAANTVDVRQAYSTTSGDRKEYNREYRERRKAILQAAQEALRG